MQIENTLKEIGLTGSEAKVYLASLKIGQSSKGKILSEWEVASSKIYTILEKLMKKGLVSMIIKNNVRFYSPAPLQRIRDFLNNKKKQIEEEERIIEKAIPLLTNLQTVKNESIAEIFKGWNGLETAYSSILSKLQKNEDVLIIGASKGTNVEMTQNFFSKYSNLAKSKGINVKIIFNESSRKYVSDMEKELKIHFDKRFLSKSSSVEMAITLDYMAIVILKEEPIIILIKDRETADSFITYFKALWEIAKK